MKIKEWDIPWEIEILLIAASIFLGPYLIIRAALEKRKAGD